MRSLSLPSLALSTLLACTALNAQSNPPASGQSSGAAKSTNTGNAPTAPNAPTASNATSSLMATDPGYRLSTGDEIAINVHNEDDLSVARRIDKHGVIRMPYVNEINLANKTVLEAETHIQQLLIERKLIKAPHVTITVRDYFAYEVTFSGDGVQPGIYRLPREAASIEIVELITRYGGLKPTAKAHDVKVYRKDESGVEKVLTVDVEAMMSGKKNAATSFLIYPGDRLYVVDRIF